jgi:lipid A 3-O-deacylase
MNRLLLLMIICMCKYSYFAQDTASACGSLKVTYANDFFNATDRYFTQGIAIDFTHAAIGKSSISFLLIKLRNKQEVVHALKVEQDVFTPKSIRYKGGEIYYGERPYTAVAVHRDFGSSLTSQLDLGIMGPQALGEEEQKGIHKALNNIQPQGWDNQLSTAYILNYRLRYDRKLLSAHYFESITKGSLRAGSLYTDAEFGLISRIGLMPSYFSSPCSWKCNAFSIYFFLSADLKFVAFNATLEGGLFSPRNVYELRDNEITRIVSNIETGVVVGAKRMRLQFSKSYVTPEFKNGLDHGWGTCSFQWYLDPVKKLKNRKSTA